MDLVTSISQNRSPNSSVQKISSKHLFSRLDKVLGQGIHQKTIELIFYKQPIRCFSDDFVPLLRYIENFGSKKMYYSVY